MNSKAKDPLFNIVKRDALPWYHTLGIRLLAIVAALIVCAIVTTIMTGINPIQVYSSIFLGAFGTARKTWITFQNVAILLLISLALTPAFRMRFWNIGGEGQVLIGGLASAACMICLADKLPNAVVILLMVVTSIGAGALWGAIPAFFKAKWNTNETLSTLMMNYIATQLVAFYTIVWEMPKGSGKIGIINQKTNIGWLPEIFGSKYLLSIIVAVIVTVVMYIYFTYSKQGYEISVVGESVQTARYVGIKVEKVIIRTMLISGGICGLVGLLVSRRHQSYGDNHDRKRTGIYGCYGIVDGKVQSVCHDLYKLSDYFHEPWSKRDLHNVWPESVVCGYPDRNYPVFHYRM